MRFRTVACAASLWRLAGRGGLSALLLVGCARPTIPDPRDAARRYADAVRSGDAATVHDMLSARSRERYGRQGVERLLVDARAELAAQASAVADPRASVSARGELRYSSGLRAGVTVEDGQTYVDAAGLLPLVPRTPADALRELHNVLASRSYRGLLRLLVADGRAELESQITSLVAALEEPEALEVIVDGENADAVAPGGHHIQLRKEDGVWRVVDFQ